MSPKRAGYLALIGAFARWQWLTWVIAVLTLSPALLVRVITRRRPGVWMSLTLVVTVACADTSTSSNSYVSLYLAIPIFYAAVSALQRLRRQRQAQKVGLPTSPLLAGCSTPEEASQRALLICKEFLCAPFAHTRVLQRLVGAGITRDAATRLFFEVSQRTWVIEHGPFSLLIDLWTMLIFQFVTLVYQRSNLGWWLASTKTGILTYSKYQNMRISWYLCESNWWMMVRWEFVWDYPNVLGIIRINGESRYQQVRGPTRRVNTAQL